MITIWHGNSKLFLLLLTAVLLLSGCSGKKASPEEAEALAEKLSQQYSVTLHTGEEAVLQQPWDYSFTAETDAEVNLENLRILEDCLSAYPKGMIPLLSEDCGGLQICLVKEILGKEDTGGLSSARGLQFRDEQGRAFLVLAKDIKYTCYHELCHILEDFIQLRTPVFDSWEALNPPGFSYDLDFIKNQERDPKQYLQTEDRAFIDTYSMSFPREDRARIMEYAMTEGNEGLFASPILQEKLRLLSRGIREAFGLLNSRKTYAWEQYLK